MKGFTCLRELPACCRAVIPDKHLKIRFVHFSPLFTLNMVKKKKKSLRSSVSVVQKHRD